MGQSLKGARAMKAFRQALQAFGGTLTTSQMASFVEIYLSPGITVVELAERQGFDQSTATRNADILGAFGRGHKKGLRLVERREDTNDRRVRGLHLTTSGHRTASRIIESIERATV